MPLPQVPADSVAEKARAFASAVSSTTAEPSPAAVQLPPMKALELPAKSGNSVALPQVPADSVAYMGWPFPSSPTAVQSPAAVQLTPLNATPETGEPTSPGAVISVALPQVPADPVAK